MTRRLPMKNLIKTILLLIAFTYACFDTAKADAQTVNIPIENDDYLETDIYAGDCGQIQPVLDGLTDDYGNSINPSELQISYIVDTSYSPGSYSDTCMTVDAYGNYATVRNGRALVTVIGSLNSSDPYYYTDNGYYTVTPSHVCFFAAILFSIEINPDGISLESESLSLYGSGIASGNKWYSESTASLNLNSSYDLNEASVNVSYSYTKGRKINMDCSLENNCLTVHAFVTSKNTVERSMLTYIINGRKFTIELTFHSLHVNKRSLVAAKGKTAALKLCGTDKAPEWTSSDPKVVSVSKTGNIKCHKKGNAIITAAWENHKVGCAVSVISPKMLKVIKYASYMGKHWKYSQPKRMSPGYYDCSSLVWKAYKKAGKYIGNAKSYAPVAADIAKWSAGNGKTIAKSYGPKQVDNMIFAPGDLAFRTGAENHRYKGIYHVEMFAGYAFGYYDEKGNPHLNELWAVRPEGYYGGGLLVIRPYPNL